MRALDRLKTGAGLTALAATLLLSSPGVKAVRAEDTTGGANQCSADAPGEAEAANTQAVLAALAQQQLAAQAAPQGDEDFIVLNNRGYNYAPNVRVDQEIQKVLQEAVRNAGR